MGWGELQLAAMRVVEIDQAVFRIRADRTIPSRAN